ncbi:3'-5' exonuclease [Nocardiopsis baichengensis]|uniref:3'-5' exonuclease n=1 Tax=Nocardiopsis baichengensis TaxID=280240 RepID=UPI0003467B54|nr:3'-5' exonuclease [Nocardiopsis baichengensis]
MPDEPAAQRPVGAARTATALTRRTGWPVRTRDIARLAEAGHLAVVGRWEGRALYDRAAAAAVPEQVLADLAAHRRLNSPPGLAIAAFADHLAEAYGLRVAACYRPSSGRWLLDWPPRPDGHPDPARLRAELAAHPAGAFRRLVDLAPPAHRAVAAARRALAPGAAVVLDTETTGLGPGAAIVEAAVVDAATGQVLLDTLVHPDGVPVEAGARAKHGIADAELAAAPAWPQVWPRLATAVAGRAVIAYSADFDRRMVIEACRRYGIPRPRWAWACAMDWRGAAAHTTRPGPLGGAHRARGDAQAALDVVRTVAATAYAPGDNGAHDRAAR